MCLKGKGKDFATVRWVHTSMRREELFNLVHYLHRSIISTIQTLQMSAHVASNGMTLLINENSTQGVMD